MLTRSVKYIAVIAINLVLLTLLLLLWTDRLELLFHEWVRPREFLKILVFSLLSLVGIIIFTVFTRKRNITSNPTKVKIAALLTFLISLYLYIDYSAKVYTNVILNGRFRNGIADKIKPFHYLANGISGDKLAIEEYQQITKINWFPEIPSESSNIKFEYAYDGFLPDYVFTVYYDVPKEMQVHTINYDEEDFSKYHSFKIEGDKKRVTYRESEE